MDNNFWDSRFRDNPGLYGVEPNKYFKEKLNFLSPGNLLLPGEGEGRNALFAASLGWGVSAFDQSSVAAVHTLTKANALNLQITYQVSTAVDFSYKSNFYDSVALIYFHLPLNIRAQVHAKINASLKKEGSLIIEGFGKSQLQYHSGGPGREELLFEVEALKNEFEGINWVESYDSIVNLNEGEGHKGKAHVVRLYGIKV